jgi:hypothetical protein
MSDQPAGEWASFRSNMELKYPFENKIVLEILSKMENIWKEVKPYDTLADRLAATTTREGKIEASMLFHVMMVAWVKYIMEVERMR